MPRTPKGRWTTEHGYVVLSGGPNGSGLYEHRVIIEKAIGRKLESNELVHHKDGNRQNNNLSNLEIMTYGEHNLMHLSNKVETSCGFCNKSVKVWPSKLKNSISGLVFCDCTCKAKYFNKDGIKGMPFVLSEDRQIMELRGKELSYGKIGKILSRNRESIRTRYLHLKESA